ncbi:hypothetical protein [Micromonospora sp. M42]|uniref:hypothetical protein n=1 Tax=Micromonospora sp. M42 TaxID=457406 RepID=UPI0006907725|nr:hypothetical protein [Micromonospora sp. M42]
MTVDRVGQQRAEPPALVGAPEQGVITGVRGRADGTGRRRTAAHDRTLAAGVVRPGGRDANPTGCPRGLVD